MSTLQANEAREMTAEISQTVLTEGESEPKRNDNSKPTSDAVETSSTHSIPDDKAVEDAKERGQNLLNESIEAEEKAVASSPDGRFLEFDIEIGRGSFKTVFKGLDTETGVAVAWCELQDKYSKSERSRFKEEAVMLKQLTHPNIVKFHEFFERPKAGQKDKKQLILVTELMTSGTLKMYLKRFKGVREKVLKSWCRQILEGLYFLHTRTPPIIHRDLKCDNIFVNGSTGLIKIGDLGLATLKKHSFAKSVIGTPEFMAPEMYEERYDESIDVYAFGMCMLEMVTLEYPYMECQNAAQIYKRVTQGIPPDCLAKVENADIYDIIQGCTKYKTDERYTIPYLLKCPFFKLDAGIKVDLVLPLEVDPDKPELVKLQLRLGDPKLRRDKHKDNEAIQFDFDLVKDNPEKISKELVSSGFIDANRMQLVTKTIKQCVELVKRDREKGTLEEKENDKESSVEKNNHPSESFHNVSIEEHAKSLAEEPGDQPHNARSAIASQSNKQVQQPSQPQPQPTQQVQSQIQQPPQQQRLTTEPEPSQEVRSRQNSTNEELSAQPQPPKVTPSSAVASKDSGFSSTSVASSVAEDPTIGQRLEPLTVSTTAADPKPDPESPDTEKVLLTTTESSSTVSEKASNETVSMSSSGASSTISLPGSQPTSQTSTQQLGHQSTTSAPAQSMGKTKKKERAFKLTLLTATGDVIECSFDTYKNYRITFKFDINEDESMDIAKSMIESGHLRETNKVMFVERLRRILSDARSKKDSDNGTVRLEHQTSIESNPGSAHTLPTPTEKNEAFQFPSQPNSEPSSQQNVQSTVPQETPQLGDPTTEQDPGLPGNQQATQHTQNEAIQSANQQSSAQVNQQDAKSQPSQQTVHVVHSEPTPQVEQQPASQAIQPNHPHEVQQPSNTQAVNPQSTKQPTEPVMTQQAEKQTTQQVNNQGTEATPQQPNQSVNQTNQQATPTVSQQLTPTLGQQATTTVNQQATSTVNQQATPRVNQQATSSVNQQATPPTPQSSPQTTPQVESKPHHQTDHQTVIPPTSFPQPLVPPQDTSTKPPPTKTPTEVRTVVAKKKQFQVQVIEEPQNGSATNLPITPFYAQTVTTNDVPQDSHANTSVPHNPQVNASVQQDTHANTSLPQNSHANAKVPQSPQVNTSVPQDPLISANVPQHPHVNTSVALVPFSKGNVAQDPHMNTDVPQDPHVNTNVPRRTSPVQEVAARVPRTVPSSQATIGQNSESVNSNAEMENTTQVRPSLPEKVLNTEASNVSQTIATQGDLQHAIQSNPAVNAQTAHIPAGSPTTTQRPIGLRPRATSSPRPSSPFAPVMQPSSSVATTSASTTTSAAQTSLEPKNEASIPTETREAPHERIHVQSPISSHPPINIPGTAVADTDDSSQQTTNDFVTVASEKSQKSSTDSEKSSTKHDDIMAQLTSSIQTQTSFDRNTRAGDQSKKSAPTERKTIEKSSSDELPPGYDDSDGSVSSEKSYSRQSSDSLSAHDMDIPSVVHKSIETLQAKMDVEHWLNQTGLLDSDGESGLANLQLSREETDELKRMCKKQEKERVEMQTRQTRELGDFYRKLEQRKNDKLPKDSKRSSSTTTVRGTITTTSQQTTEHKTSNGHTIKTTVKKQILHSDEHLKKLQQRSMQQFEYDATKKKGGAIGGWPASKHGFNQMKAQPGVTSAGPMVMKAPRAVAPTSSSSMPHIPQSTPGFIPHTSSSMVFANSQNNIHGNLAGQMHHKWHGENTGVYWTNGANQNWPANQANIEGGNGIQRGQPISFPDNTRHVAHTDMNSWQANGPYHPVATQPQQQQQNAQSNNPPRTDAMDNTKHIVLPSR